jgi:hypothetical protein
MLEAMVQHPLEHQLDLVGLIRMDVVLIISTLEEVTTCTLGCTNGIGKGKVLEPPLTKQDSSGPDEGVLGLGVQTALATTSPAELQPVEGPLELYRIGMNLPIAESIVADGVWITANLAGGGDSRGSSVVSRRCAGDSSEE